MSNIFNELSVLGSSLQNEASSLSEVVAKVANDVPGASGISVAISVFSVLGTIVIALSVLPQTIKTFKDRDTANISFLLFFLTGVATFFLTLYGIGLVTVYPNSFNFLADIVVDGAKASYVFNYQEWVAGFLVPGIFLIAGEFFASITSFAVAFIKLNNSLKAKKANLSESVYYERYIKPTLNLKGGK